MLLELHIENLGIIRSATLALGPGLTVFTGETGAGKTMLVEAIDLVVGGRADAAVVGPHGDEARVEGRFLRRVPVSHGDSNSSTVDDGTVEVVLTRVVPSDGRSRAYVDGRPATAGTLSEIAAELVDIHGQHAHQSLLSAPAQRAALDAHGRIDTSPIRKARESIASIDETLASLGGDPRERAREMDLLEFQVREIESAALGPSDEDEQLEREEDRLTTVVAAREALERLGTVFDDDGPLAGLRSGLRDIQPISSLGALAERLQSVLTDLEDVGGEVRRAADGAEEDPERLAQIRARRQLLRDLTRKYGDSLEAVQTFGRTATERLEQLRSWSDTVDQLTAQRSEAESSLLEAQRVVGDARRALAPGLASRVESRLRDLGMPHATIGIRVSDEPAGDEVTFLLAANPGTSMQPLAKVASGGELARAMLALRLVLMGVPSVLVFDEVDAGIGGSAAVAVGRALSQLGSSHQVFAVTHLPQVAAAATTQILVEKSVEGGTTVGRARSLTPEERVAEISRMLSGGLADEPAREHARRLLEEMAPPS